MPNIRVLATGLEFPEGPVVMPDGSVVLVEIRGQRLTRVWPDGRKEVVAQIPGGPNGAALGPDGKMYVCNNGGFSWIPTRNMIMPGPQPARSRPWSTNAASIRCGDRMILCSTGTAESGSPTSASGAPATWTSVRS